jgi:ubiquinone/menaquinone biosynthesis C-methylase UbiE
MGAWLDEVVWVGHTTHYRGGSAEFAVAARTLAEELGARLPQCEVRLDALRTKADFVAAMKRIADDGRVLRELHFVGHSGMYGVMFGSTKWPEQMSPYEWRTLRIPFAEGASAHFHACRTARWFAPFFAKTFGVTTYGNQNYTTVSARKDRFRWAGPWARRNRRLYLVATPGKKSHGALGSLRKYAGARTEPMTECSPSEFGEAGSYDAVSRLYDAAFADIRVRRAEWAWLSERFEEAQKGRGALRALDLGCGNGALLEALGARVLEGTGLDASAGMIERARERHAAKKHLRFERIDGPNLPLADASVDVVVSFLSFRYLDWDPVMREVRRVLAPGGRLLVVDMVEKPLEVRDATLLFRSMLRHAGQRVTDRAFVTRLKALTSHPEWRHMLTRNPIRAEHEYRWYFESRFPGRKLETLEVGRRARVVAFDSGPLERGVSEPLSYP